MRHVVPWVFSLFTLPGWLSLSIGAAPSSLEETVRPVIQCPPDTVVMLEWPNSLAAVDFAVTVEDDGLGGCGDIVWVVDATGSMYEEQAALASYAEQFLIGLGEGDFQFGVLAFSAHSHPVATTGVLKPGGPNSGEFTTDPSSFVLMVTAVGSAAGGIENGLTALNDALEFYPFRENCCKLLVLVTDEDADDIGEFASLVPPLITSSAHISTVLDYADSAGYSDLAPLTEGSRYDFYTSWGTVLGQRGSEVCHQLRTTSDPASGSLFPLGETSVLCAVTDEFGNADSCSFTITVEYACDCPHQADPDGDDFQTPVDLVIQIDIIFRAAPDVKDVPCPSPRTDFDCDGFPTALDISAFVDYLYLNGNPPCDPCAL